MRERWAESQAPPHLKTSIGLGLCVQANVQKTRLVVELLELSFYWQRTSRDDSDGRAGTDYRKVPTLSRQRDQKVTAGGLRGGVGCYGGGTVVAAGGDKARDD
ncbi:hypothetical protein PIB30_028423 [Stylosanthes scabra]|uniref:Uncharacterized protein n=1 Tax=Stylosanthes scabra TaxID=79078 RepID=A0ABU6W903_9FABA|nr:hypothetical protein [Stylosanthes scabra]